MDEIISVIEDSKIIHRLYSQIIMGIMLILFVLYLCSFVGSGKIDQSAILNQSKTKCLEAGKVERTIGAYCIELVKKQGGMADIENITQSMTISDMEVIDAVEEPDTKMPVLNETVIDYPASTAEDIPCENISVATDDSTAVDQERPVSTVDYMDTVTEEKELNGFLIDTEGYITGYVEQFEVVDGLVVFPNTSCKGIRSSALTGLEENIMELYIPANVVDIEVDAFSYLPYVMYIEVAEDNPAYMSVEGILYTKDGELVAYPEGRELLN